MAKKDTKKGKNKKRELIKVPTNCSFCKEGKEPDYKDFKTLAKFVTDRAKIVGRSRSGICAKHQRRLTIEIKRARHLGLLPFTPAI